MEGSSSRLRLFVSTKEVYEKQEPPKAQAPDESQKILADALKQYRDDMSQDEKEALARATVRKLSYEQLRNLTPGQIAESIVRVDKQLKGMGGEMAGGVNDAIKGTGWERVAGVARGVKGAASFWAFLSFAALIVASIVPGLNVVVLAASAFAATIVAYAAADLQQEAEIKLAGTAKSPEEFQKHSLVGATARTETIIMAIGMALPIVGKFIGKLPFLAC